ncbi:MAG: 3-dehydroquinate synthase [Cytophagaceae bacterium]|nr:3-dehydroquinate synthase [Cytophagaceae bacterium]MBL0302418.1 3-dehydroquinate synthase [Cytophagaceae bacterium]MBL0325244.1 3-dehydroquinate synthase [Cytophagaceae bacterium]
MSVQIGPISETLSQYLSDKNYSKVMVLVDQNTKKHCYESVKPLLPAHKVIQIKAGEENKNLETCSYIWEQMTENELDRHSLLVNLGGGVIGDMGGFCAATYKRGIDFIQIPTTLLSQVDASVGGKLGIDFQGFKNHLGVFTLPNAVLIDKEFLKSLPERELRSGFAEIIKHCLIQDAAKWKEIKILDLDQQNLGDLIQHSVEIKKKVVTADPTEKGLRKILNFGHTLGHAIETFFLDKGKKRLLHGEAIAAGMIAEAYIGFQKGMLKEDELAQIEEFIYAVYGTVNIDSADFDTIIKLTQQDKKNRGKLVRASILKGIGDCAYDISLSKTDMKKALAYYSGK